MNIHSSRRIYTGVYKTLDILKFFVLRSGKHKHTFLVNKKKTMFKTFCPFHSEKTASFIIYSQSNKEYVRYENREWGYKCLGCGRSGDIFKFLRDMEGMEMWDSLSFLRKTFPHIENRIIKDKNQLVIPFPHYQTGDFLWLSSDMRQIGFT